MHSNVEFFFEPKSENFDANDDRWLEQVNELILDCRREGCKVEQQVEATEGMKGGFEDLLMVLGSSGVITAVVEIFKGWISIDRTRSLVLKIKDGDRIIEYEVSGKGLSKEKMEEFMNKALEIHSRQP
jgi:hypothetical protein